jgi:hypothetical protein
MGPTDPAVLEMQADAVKNGVPISQIIRGRGKEADAQLRQIEARVVQKYGNTFNWAGALQNYHADTSSLTKLQGNRDAVVAFENTANKNLDMFADLAKSIPDSGVPWVNTPLRLLDEKIVGSDNIAAVNAARQVANTEIAKVTSNPGLSGQLSDSARHEVMEYNPKDATFKQTLAVAKVLRKDMKNRHDSLDEMLGEIKGRSGGGTGGAPAPQATGPKSDPLGIR